MLHFSLSFLLTDATINKCVVELRLLNRSTNTLVFLLITVLTGQLIQRIEEVRYEAMLNAFDDSGLALVCIKNDCSFSRPGISHVSHVLNELY